MGWDGLDQVRMIRGKGIRRLHTAGLAQFQRRAKDVALIHSLVPSLMQPRDVVFAISIRVGLWLILTREPN